MKEHEENEEMVIENEAVQTFGEDIDPLEEETRIDTKLTKVKKDLEQCRAQKQEYLDGWQRAKADYVNAVRRFKDENKNATTVGIVKAAEAFLPAFDSLERAKDAGEVPDGFEAIIKQIESAFTALNISEVEALVGESFDPTYHEALGQDNAENAEQDGKISSVLEKGWKVGETVIRHAKVRVAHYE